MIFKIFPRKFPVQGFPGALVIAGSASRFSLFAPRSTGHVTSIGMTSLGIILARGAGVNRFSSNYYRMGLFAARGRFGFDRQTCGCPARPSHEPATVWRCAVRVAGLERQIRRSVGERIATILWCLSFHQSPSGLENYPLVRGGDSGRHCVDCGIHVLLHYLCEGPRRSMDWS